MPVRQADVHVQPCSNKEADEIFLAYYWMKRIRRSRRLSYAVFYCNEKVAWLQVAEPFGTKLTKPLDCFNIQEAVELCRGYFIDAAPSNIESCAIGKILRLLPNDWYKNFSAMKKVVILYQDIDAKQQGIVYRALNFKPYAFCVRARHYTEPKRGNSSGKKILWARGLRPVSGQHYSLSMPVTDFSTHPSQKATLLPKGKSSESYFESIEREKILK